MTPVPRVGSAEERGVVGGGAVGSRLLGQRGIFVTRSGAGPTESSPTSPTRSTAPSSSRATPMRSPVSWSFCPRCHRRSGVGTKLVPATCGTPTRSSPGRWRERAAPTGRAGPRCTEEHPDGTRGSRSLHDLSRRQACQPSPAADDDQRGVMTMTSVAVFRGVSPPIHETLPRHGAGVWSPSGSPQVV